jgi:exosome complex RNA-binding protein Rrp42 (RNase PH superfamily)
LFWKRGVRSDGRLFAEARPISIQHGILHTSAASGGGGSALVTLGSPTKSEFDDDARSSSSSRTMVMAAVTVQVGQPSALAPHQGDVVVTITSAAGGPGRPGSNGSGTNVVQSFVQRILEENLGSIRNCPMPPPPPL